MFVDGRYMCDDRSTHQHFAEVFSRDALRVSVAMQQLSLDEREVVYIDYAAPEWDRAEKSRIMMISRSSYYRRLKAGNLSLSQLIDA